MTNYDYYESDVYNEQIIILLYSCKSNKKMHLKRLDNN